jgi:hypothetical protein
VSWNKLNPGTALKAGQSIALLIPTTQGRYQAKGLQTKPTLAKVATPVVKGRAVASGKTQGKIAKSGLLAVKPQGKPVRIAKK